MEKNDRYIDTIEDNLSQSHIKNHRSRKKINLKMIFLTCILISLDVISI